MTPLLGKAALVHWVREAGAPAGLCKAPGGTGRGGVGPGLCWAWGRRTRARQPGPQGFHGCPSLGGTRAEPLTAPVYAVTGGPVCECWACGWSWWGGLSPGPDPAPPHLPSPASSALLALVTTQGTGLLGGVPCLRTSQSLHPPPPAPRLGPARVAPPTPPQASLGLLCPCKCQRGNEHSWNAVSPADLSDHKQLREQREWGGPGRSGRRTPRTRRPEFRRLV